jgi:hypothetical protein
MSDTDETLVRGLPGFGSNDPVNKADESTDDTPVKRGPQFPDLFERAMSQSHVPDLVSVSADGTRRVQEGAPPARARAKAPAMAGASTDATSSEIGPFTGASAKRRRRWGR